MARRLRYAEDAIDDIAAIREWLTQPGAGRAAARRLETVRAAIRRLRLNPCRCPAGDQPGVRELQCPSGYRVFYTVEPDTGRDQTAGDVPVLRVFGPGQDRRGL